KVFRIKRDDAIDAVTVAAFLIVWIERTCSGRMKHAVSEMSAVPYKGRYRQPKALGLPATALPCPNETFGASFDQELDGYRFADHASSADQRNDVVIVEPFIGHRLTSLFWPSR